MTHPYLDTPRPIAFAHRGGGLEAAENTMASFAHAVGLGYRYVETDVQATADGVLLVFHDDTLPRLTGLPGAPRDYRWSDLKSARIQGSGGPAGEPIPLFDDVADAWPDIRFNIDPKTDHAADVLAQTLRRRPELLDRICIGSFSGARLARLRAAFGPRLCTSAGPQEVLRVWLSGFGLPLGIEGPHCLQVPPSHRGIPIVTARFLRAAHARGLQVHVWTIDQAAAMERLLDLGVDGIMTDRPTLLRSILRRRNAWHG